MSSLSTEGALKGLTGPLRQTAAHGQVAWADHIARYDRKVVVALLARGIALEHAKELAQEAWLRLIEQQRAGKLREIKLPGLAIRQALFLAKDRSRRLGHAERCDQTGAAPLHNHEAQLFARDDLRQIARIVRRSSASTQRVFASLYGDDPRTPAQTAAELGLSLQRVRQIMCELRKLIRSHIEERHG